VIDVRIATSDDAATVARILGESYPLLLAGHYEPSLLARALPLMVHANPRLLVSGTYYLASIDGRAAGCGGWSHEEPGTGKMEVGVAHLRHFAVARDWTKRGVGKALFTRCEAEARAAGVKRLFCDSTLNGQAFYVALGFGSPKPMQMALAPDLLFPGIRLRRTIWRP